VISREIRLAQETLATVRVPHSSGCPQTRSRTLVADKGYDSDIFRCFLRRRCLRPCILRRFNQRRWGRKPDLSPHRLRGVIERAHEDSFGDIEGIFVEGDEGNNPL